jgi:hypothetical protein
VRFLDRGLIEHLAAGWGLDDVAEQAEPSSRRPLWRIAQSK